jgi:hypothetical protein
MLQPQQVVGDADALLFDAVWNVAAVVLPVAASVYGHEAIHIGNYVVATFAALLPSHLAHRAGCRI